MFFLLLFSCLALVVDACNIVKPTESCGGPPAFATYIVGTSISTGTLGLRIASGSNTGDVGYYVTNGIPGAFNGQLASVSSAALFASMHGHGFSQACFSCSGTCVETTGGAGVCSTPSGGPTFRVPTAGAPICVSFGGALPSTSDSATTSSLAELTGGALAVSINGAAAVTYGYGAVATSNGGTVLKALMLVNANGYGIYFTSCGPFIVKNTALSITTSTIGLGSLILPAYQTSADGFSFSVNPSTSQSSKKPFFVVVFVFICHVCVGKTSVTS